MYCIKALPADTLYSNGEKHEKNAKKCRASPVFRPNGSWLRSFSVCGAMLVLRRIVPVLRTALGLSHKMLKALFPCLKQYLLS
jgi:hypothetical protein